MIPLHGSYKRFNNSGGHYEAKQFVSYLFQSNWRHFDNVNFINPKLRITENNYAGLSVPIVQI